ncbi:Mu transposase C-terminal domain-containing protein [Derxia gummosa]|uniref:Mu transposase C-terminal domain-containing protein n=1 Tax=Derxia gummosa DSM 723 TaxID=1121388 RepID=A0A8B6XBS7_9BURK|nr:Mu transposase C-terminal domain-containing protein [Derxia gummosa]
MLTRNDIFLADGIEYRLLWASAETNRAWVICLDRSNALPQLCAWDALAQQKPYRVNDARWNPAVRKATPAMQRVRDDALKALAGIQSRTPDIFEPAQRARLVDERIAAGHSKVAIYKHLRRYWRGGQVHSALLGNFDQSRHKCVGLTTGRGRPSPVDVAVYQLEATDLERFKTAIERYYFSDERRTLAHTYQRLLEAHYQTVDGNNIHRLRPPGERPTYKQLRHYLLKNYGAEHVLRKRKGDKEFEREHRAVLGTVLQDCLGVGHQYEADATIVDVFLVASSDSRKIIGKPTLYLIVDRKSRLIVGWYIGLENASWICALQALVTISADKRSLCEQYGVTYDPRDWPAHEVFPSEIIADRGELLTQGSDQVIGELNCTIANVSAKRPDHKPVVETQFKQTRMTLQDGTPGFDPPENAKRRQGKHYEKDACLTLHDFTAVMLTHIIEHNRRPMRDYDCSLAEVAAGVIPSPIAIWNHNISSRAGLLTRFSEERVRIALLPRGEATVTEHGIEFQGCIYTCQEAIARGWFVDGRKRRFKVMVTYESRLVDIVYIHAPDKAALYVGILSPRAEKYRGLSFAEVKAFERERARMRHEIEHQQAQARADLHAATAGIFATAAAKLAAAGIKKSRTARRADIAEDRQQERRLERQALGTTMRLTAPDGIAPAVATVDDMPARGSNVLPLRPEQGAIERAAESNRKEVSAQPLSQATNDSPRALSLADKLRLAQEKMRNG